MKSAIGAILIVVGISGLIYAAFMFINNASGTRDVKSLIIFGILGLLFFICGISLVRAIRESPE